MLFHFPGSGVVVSVVEYAQSQTERRPQLFINTHPQLPADTFPHELS